MRQWPARGSTSCSRVRCIRRMAAASGTSSVSVACTSAVVLCAISVALRREVSPTSAERIAYVLAVRC
ncbi:hypothetical protein HMPREF3099_11310 [Kytococcus sp. HMSC28H12]|nr:hypothetical protein HMPREF3099_11310 [Kytococcus sp. HMSC28H12]